LLIPNISRTWAPKGQTPFFRHLYKQDRISTISALSVSPAKKHIVLYIRCRTKNLTGLDIRTFLRELTGHLKGQVVLLWDRGTIHRRTEVKEWLFKHPKIHTEFFPAYAPELNPAEYVWNQADHALSNSVPQDLRELKEMLKGSLARIRGSQKLLWSCIYASDLPWTK
jgi:transposase